MDSHLDELFNEHRQRLRWMIELRMDRRLQGRISTSDVIQETFLEAHRRSKDYQPEKMPPFLWLRMIAGQKLVDLHRHHIGAGKRSVLREIYDRSRMPEASSAALAGALADSMTSVSQAVMKAELRLQVEDVIARMDEFDREVLALRHYEQLTNAEIAQVLNISPNAASNRYVRAVQRLKDAMGQSDLAQ